MRKLLFKVADQADEFEQIFRLNYRTFVEEIPQHEVNPERRLVDKFHEENTYFICKDGERLLGMLTARDKRPFSLDFKLKNLDSYLPPYNSICEFRLLAIEPDRRRTRILAGLMLMLAEFFDEHGYDLAVMSGTTRQSKMYHHLGFVSFGQLVGTEGAYYQPMYLTLDASRRFRAATRIFVRPFLSSR